MALKGDIMNHLKLFPSLQISEMKYTVLVVVLVSAVLTCHGLENFLQHPLYDCVKCLCHGVSGCWIRQNCAKYSINKDYWRKAGSLSIDGTNSDSDDNYNRCIRNENCVVGTVIKYTESFGNLDCNCDGLFNCKDRAAIHLFGQNCESPKYGRRFADRFNRCAASAGVGVMLSSEGGDDCTVPEPV